METMEASQTMETTKIPRETMDKTTVFAPLKEDSRTQEMDILPRNSEAISKEATQTPISRMTTILMEVL